MKNNLDIEKLSPRKRSQQIKFYGNDDEVVMDAEELPQESSKKRSSKFMNEAKHQSMIERLHDKDKDFHHFMESSRMLVEDDNKREPTEQPIMEQPSPSSNFQGKEMILFSHV